MDLVTSPVVRILHFQRQLIFTAALVVCLLLNVSHVIQVSCSESSPEGLTSHNFSAADYAAAGQLLQQQNQQAHEQHAEHPTGSSGGSAIPSHHSGYVPVSEPYFSPMLLQQHHQLHQHQLLPHHAGTTSGRGAALPTHGYIPMSDPYYGHGGSSSPLTTNPFRKGRNGAYGYPMSYGYGSYGSPVEMFIIALIIIIGIGIVGWPFMILIASLYSGNTALNFVPPTTTTTVTGRRKRDSAMFPLAALFDNLNPDVARRLADIFERVVKSEDKLSLISELLGAAAAAPASFAPANRQTSSNATAKLSIKDSIKDSPSASSTKKSSSSTLHSH